MLPRDADKSLSRAGREQATATKLGIYSTYSPRSSIHFLARCSNFCKPLKKKSGCPSNQISAAAMTSASDKKWRTFNCFFQFREQVVVRRGQIRRIEWVIKKLEAQVGQFFFSGLHVPGEPEHCRARTRSPWWPSRPAAFFLQNVLQLHQQRWVILRVDSLALWKIINVEDAVLLPKNRDENFPVDFCIRNIFGVGWAPVPPLHWLLIYLRVIVIWPGFVHGHQTRQEITWIVPKKFQICSDDWHRWGFDPHSGISGPSSRRTSACPNFQEWWTQPAHVRYTVARLLI